MKTRRILSVVLAMAMVFGTMGTVVFAEEEEISVAVAKIDDVEYTTLQDAISAAAEGQTVMLLNDVNLSDWTSIDVKKAIVFDGNGKTITGLTNSLFNNVSADFEIKNLTVSGADITLTSASGLDNDTSAAALVQWANGGTLTLTNVSVKDSTIKGDGYVAAMVGFVDSTADGVVVSGGIIDKTILVAGGTVGSVAGHTYADVTVSDTQVSNNSLESKSDDGTRPDKVGLIVGRPSAGTVSISVNMDNSNSALPVYGINAHRVIGSIPGGKAVVTGGSYPTDPTLTEKEGQIVSVIEGYEIKKAENNRYNVQKKPPVVKIDDIGYDTLAEAIMAAKENDVIKLMDNIADENDIRVSIVNSIVIDLNEKTVNADWTFDSKALITLQNGTINGDITVEPGYEKILINNIKHSGSISADAEKLEINSGYFTTDVSQYLAEGKKLSASDVKAYAYKISEKTAGTVDATVTAGESKVNDAVLNVTVGETTIEKGAVTSAIANTGNNSDNKAALAGAANMVEVKEEIKTAAAQQLGVEEAEVQLVKKPYFEVKAAVVSENSEDSEKSDTLKYTVKAMCETVATATDKPEVSLGAEEIKVTQPIEMTLPVPASAVTENKVVVKHTKDKKDGGLIFYYEATVTDGVAAFTNPNGFSTFEILPVDDATVVAKVGDSGFATLQEAVNYIDNNGTVTVVKNENLTVELEESKTFTVKNEYKVDAVDTAITVTINETDYPIAAAGTETITYTKPAPSTPSTGGGASTSYTVTFDSNGGSKVESIKARRGNTIKEPTAPTKDGYIFDGWYKDSGFTTKFNFASTTIIKDTTLYAKWIKDGEEEPEKPEESETPEEVKGSFADVDSKAWYYEAIKFVTDNKLMNGVTENKFAPDAQLTRGMLVTILYRNEGEPETDDNTVFTDVEAGFYYENAIAWTKANGIVNGVTDTQFAPDENISREQIATILFRYAQHKGLEAVNMAENLSSFSDSNDISEYAVSALNWAVGSGLINGKTETTLNPQDNATRAEIATILQRFIEANK